MKIDKYQMYEVSVQTPEVHIEFMDETYREIRGRKPLHLREDFCGTFLISTEWIKSDPKRTAVGLDLDPEPLAYGKKHHLSKLDGKQKKRMSLLKKNVKTTTKLKTDFCLAGNFSFNIFKEWKDLVEYFTAVRKSLDKDGLFAAEMAGGPGLVEEVKDRRKIDKNGKPWFTYLWNQQKFDPITHHCFYSIDFKMHKGEYHGNVFTYDWRLWTIPEIRTAMKEAGFAETHVYWDMEDDEGNNEGEYKRLETADNDHAWICYVVGLKSPWKGRKGQDKKKTKKSKKNK